MFWHVPAVASGVPHQTRADGKRFATNSRVSQDAPSAANISWYRQVCGKPCLHTSEFPLARCGANEPTAGVRNIRTVPAPGPITRIPSGPIRVGGRRLTAVSSCQSLQRAGAVTVSWRETLLLFRRRAVWPWRRGPSVSCRAAGWSDHPRNRVAERPSMTVVFCAHTQRGWPGCESGSSTGCGTR